MIVFPTFECFLHREAEIIDSIFELFVRDRLRRDAADYPVERFVSRSRYKPPVVIDNKKILVANVTDIFKSLDQIVVNTAERMICIVAALRPRLRSQFISFPASAA